MIALFTREPVPAELTAVRTGDASSFLQRLAATPDVDRVLVSDLSLGAWRGHQVARELLAQLGADRAEARAGVARDGREIGRRLDRETGGDQAVLAALRLASDVADALGAHGRAVACVLVPRDGSPLEREDTLFLHFLEHALRSTEHAVLLVATATASPGLRVEWHPDGAVPSQRRAANWLLPLVPGILDPAAADALSAGGDDVLELGGGCVLVDPAVRTLLTQEARDGYDELAARTAAPPWLAAYANWHRDDASVDTTTLWEQAQRELARDAVGVPLRLLDRAANAAQTPAQTAVFRLQAQGVRIGARLFEEAAAIPDPEPRVPAPVRGLLLFTKGWALTMRDEVEQAEERLSAARSLMAADARGEEWLSLLNITALNRLKGGDWNGALALEHEIRATLDEIGRRWQMRYINSLNLARLHRMRGAFETAERYYAEAFATADGVRSDSDAVHANAATARLVTSAARADDALAAWTRAALHWVASPAPEAISPRVVAAVAGNGAGSGIEACDAVADAFVEHLETTAEAAGVAATNDAPEKAPAFIAGRLLSPELSRREWRAVLGSGWGVLGAQVATPPLLASRANERLRLILARLLGVGLPCTVVVDDRLGRELPRSEDELIEVALRLGTTSLVTADGRVLFTADSRPRLEAQLCAALSLAVDSIDEGVVVFKRYLEPLRLSPADIELVVAALGGASVGSLAASGGTDVLARLRALERARVLDLYIQTEAPRPSR